MRRLWLFDFDGTLIDSEKSIKACYLKIGQELIPERSKFIKNMVIGPTLDESAKKILTEKNLHLLVEFKSKFQQQYDSKLVLQSPQYPGVNEVLRKLHALGDHLCIVTNKRSIPTRKLIDYFCWNDLFSWVACMDEYPELKTKAELIKSKEIYTNLYRDIYFVGDTINDGICANQNKIKFIKASYGYGIKQNWNGIDIFSEIKCINELITNPLFQVT